MVTGSQVGDWVCCRRFLVRSSWIGGGIEGRRVNGLDGVLRRKFHGHMQLDYIQGAQGPTATVQVVIQK